MSSPLNGVILQREVLTITEDLDFHTLGIDKEILQIFTLALQHNTIFPFYSSRSVAAAEQEIQQELYNIDRAIQNDGILGHVLTNHKGILATVQNTLVRSLQSWSPFPELPFEVVQYLIELAAEADHTTALVLSTVSKQIQSWADKYLFRALVFHSMGPKLELLQTRARQARTCAVSTSVRISALPTQFYTLPYLQNLCFWPISPNQGIEQPVSWPLQRLNCNPHTFGPKKTVPDFSLPIFQKLTHFEITVNPQGHTEWDWSPLRNSVSLTHLKAPVLFSAKGFSAITDNLIPGLPLSIQIVILHAGDQSQPNADVLYDRLRTGQVDRRLLMAGYDIYAGWVLDITNAMSTLTPWASSLGETLWEAAAQLLQDRNTTLYPES
ncbi:hypothetical protein DL96DRAFT_1705397 [Flagelloscypha sp. PMI_526]|nr:hypothetical protein DL96DRAFT_1705397 [Flagelloscypha sp. PMI_526]